MRFIQLLSFLIISAIITTTVQPSTSYAADLNYKDYDTATKVTGPTYLICVYRYQLSIKDSKLVATGVYFNHYSIDPIELTVQLQLTKAVTYPNWYIGTDGLARVDAYQERIERGSNWELKTVIPVVRTATCKGSDKISLEISLSGLADGIYTVHEIVSKGGKKEGNYGDSTLIVIQNGKPSIQTTWFGAEMTVWWHDKDFYIY